MYTSPNDAYQALEAKFRGLSIQNEIATMLHWDSATYMPAGSSAPRSDQLAAIRLQCHEMLTDPSIGTLLDAVDPSALSEWQLSNYRLMQRDYSLEGALDASLVEARSKANSACEHAWRQAKLDNDFKAVAPLLKPVISLTEEASQAYATVLGLSPYDALLDLYAPGTRASFIDPLFDDYATFLGDFLPQVLEKQRQHPAPIRPAPVPKEKQALLVEKLAVSTGFSLERGRIDVSAHPFSTGYPGDQRITVAYHEEDPMGVVMAVLHECGHAAYEAGLPKDWARQPVGQSLGMTIHESQSLSIEMQASRSPHFLGWLANTAQAVLGADPAFEPDNFRRLQQWVEPDFIRVEADEVTYPAHVILRTRLERPLLDGSLPVDDLPLAWRDGMKDLLGLDVPDDRVGCLQDIHWYDGAFGYFPTYTLGAMLAAQLARQAHQDMPNIASALGNGEFSPLMAWLGKAIHSQGSFLTSEGLIKQATGSVLSADAFKEHLIQRYIIER